MVIFFPQSFPKGKKMGQNPKILPQILVPLAGLEPARSLDRGILSPLRLPIPPQRHIYGCYKTKENSAPRRCRVFWRRHPDLNRGIKVLQTLALPLGYSATPAALSANKIKNSTDIWSGKRDSNPRHSPWQGDALPLSYSRIFHPHCFCWWKLQGSNL